MPEHLARKELPGWSAVVVEIALKRSVLHALAADCERLAICTSSRQMFDPYTLWEGSLSSGEVATLLICPTQREVLTVLHVDHRMRRLDPCRTCEEAELKAWAIHDELVGCDRLAS